MEHPRTLTNNSLCTNEKTNGEEIMSLKIKKIIADALDLAKGDIFENMDDLSEPFILMVDHDEIVKNLNYNNDLLRKEIKQHIVTNKRQIERVKEYREKIRILENNGEKLK